MVIIGGYGSTYTGTAICVAGYGANPQNIIDTSVGKVGVEGTFLKLKRINDSVWGDLEIVNVSDANVRFWYYKI